MAKDTGFRFEGGAANFLGTQILAGLIVLFTAGICYPFALVLRERWKAKHSSIGGRQVIFVGSAIGLFGLWIRWCFLIVITCGIYGFWVAPRIQKWKWENLAFAS